MPEIIINEVSHLAGTQSMRYAPTAWEELLTGNSVDLYTVPFHEKDKLIEAYIAQELAGFISYVVDDYMLWIKMSYTRPVYRQMGVHDALFTRLCDVARKEGCKTIASMVADDNKAMRAAAKSQGRIFGFNQLRYEL